MRSFIAIFMISFMTSSLMGQEVSTAQWTLVHERTADWCPYCGGWGWDLKDKIITTFKDKNLIFLAVHYSGGLQTPLTQAFAANFGGVSQPVFFEGSTDIGANSSNISTVITDLGAVVEFNDFSDAYAGVGLDAKLDDDKNLTVNATVEILENVSSSTSNSEYYFGLYLAEDVMHSQSGKTGLVLHENVLTKSFFTEDFGKLIAAGQLNKGTVYKYSGTLSNITNSVENLKVVGIIWSKPNDKYLFFNGNIANVSRISGTNDISNSLNFTAFQGESGDIKVEVTSDESLAGAQVVLTDNAGKTIAKQSFINGDAGKKSMSFRQNLETGIYYITLTKGDKTLTKSVLYQ